MSFNELTGTTLLRDFARLMKKVLEGQVITFRYKGKLFDIVPRLDETQGQKLARLLNENYQNRSIDTSPYPYASNRDMYDKLLKKHD